MLEEIVLRFLRALSSSHSDLCGNVFAFSRPLYHAPSFRPHHHITPTVAVVCCLLNMPCVSVRNVG